MADKTRKYTDNAPGRFYVDETCIDCDACRQTAPDNYDRNEEGGYSYLSKQPETEAEVEACIDAMDGCPVEAIGDDGEA